MGPLISLLWASGDVSSGFQSQSEQHYSHLVEVYVFLRFTSGVTPADLLAASMVAELFSSPYLRAGIGGAPVQSYILSKKMCPVDLSSFDLVFIYRGHD